MLHTYSPTPTPEQPYYHPWFLRAFRSHEPNISFFGRDGGGRGALATLCRILAVYTPRYLSKLQVPLAKAILWDFSTVPPCTWA